MGEISSEMNEMCDLKSDFNHYYAKGVGLLHIMDRRDQSRKTQGFDSHNHLDTIVNQLNLYTSV